MSSPRAAATRRASKHSYDTTRCPVAMHLIAIARLSGECSRGIGSEDLLNTAECCCNFIFCSYIYACRAYPIRRIQ